MHTDRSSYRVRDRSMAARMRMHVRKIASYRTRSITYAQLNYCKRAAVAVHDLRMRTYEYVYVLHMHALEGWAGRRCVRACQRSIDCMRSTCRHARTYALARSLDVPCSYSNILWLHMQGPRPFPGRLRHFPTHREFATQVRGSLHTKNVLNSDGGC